jgi:4-diphosphocytidyl-2-C-methyl-D-erythritol kinase
MLRLHAPAKINWFLLVLGRRDDGYHDIQSLMQRVSLSDSLEFEEPEDTAPGDVRVITDAPLPEEENLVHRAALALRERAGTGRGARITLRKKIPLAAGLGGGSSDAACTLRGLGSLWGLGIPEDDLLEMAAELGSDVPFFLGGPAAVVEGRGERTTPVEIGGPVTLLLLKPPVGVSARWAYSGVREFSNGRCDVEAFLGALRKGDFGSLREVAGNDLEPPVLDGYPGVGDLKRELLQHGALFSAVSGSGTTVFGVFEDRERAGLAADSIGADFSAVVETLV